jgi:hypothetical protein
MSDAAVGVLRHSLGLACSLRGRPQLARRPRSPSEKEAAPKKGPELVDGHVGNRVRLRRKMLAMS